MTTIRKFSFNMPSGGKAEVKFNGATECSVAGAYGANILAHTQITTSGGIVPDFK